MKKDILIFINIVVKRIVLFEDEERSNVERRMTWVSYNMLKLIKLNIWNDFGDFDNNKIILRLLFLFLILFSSLS